jgi:hypothetical protein
VSFIKSVKPADATTPNRLPRNAQTGNQRRPLAKTFQPLGQRPIAFDTFASLGEAATRVLAQLDEARR